ncbi:MAG: alanine--tRNA ligase-related protein [Thiolinea sp.]
MTDFLKYRVSHYIRSYFFMNNSLSKNTDQWYKRNHIRSQQRIFMSQTEACVPRTCQAIGEAFLQLHQQEGFELLPPSSLLHDSVPMSFVMSAGLIQVENELEQIVEQTGGRFAFTQPCFRHFDVKQVGLDSTHLSLFHMSAAFHIGCSERSTVLPRLWRFLTEHLQLNPDRLWISYLDDVQYGRDQRTYDCWVQAGVDPAHLVALDKEHCFWRQRSTGQIASDGKKCGPHTEVFYERPGFACGEYCESGNPGACRCGRFVEVSNSLFIENYIDDEDRLIPAETVFSECVIGIERLAMVQQDVPDVLHVDRFDEWRERLKPFLPERLTVEQEQSVNIIIDHLSAFVKLTEDGAPEPGKGGRRYIMRKLVRGSAREALRLKFDLKTLKNAPPDIRARLWFGIEIDKFLRSMEANSDEMLIPYFQGYKS